MKITIRSNYGGGDSGGDPVRWYRGKVARVEEGSEEVLRDVMDDAAIMMAQNVSTRGTAKSGKPGRIETKKMHNDIDAKTTVSEAGRVTGRFGWIKNREDYYGFQEGGFDHVNGGHVEGMYALADAAEWANKQFAEDMRNVIRNA